MPKMGMGGSERLVHTLALHLDRSTFSPSVAWLSDEEPIKEFNDLGVPLYQIPKKGGFDFSAMKKFGGIIRKNKIDIVNAQHFMPTVYSLFGCKLANACGLVYTLHSEWELERVPANWARLARFLFRGIKVIGVTEKASVAAQAKFGLEQSQVKTILNGVDLESFAMRKSGDIASRRRLGLPAEGALIGIVANFKKVKNHLFLLKAFEDISQAYPLSKLILVGTGFRGDEDNTENDIREYIRTNRLDEKVIILGYRKDISDILGSLDVFCLVSQKEGLPISLIEAMACGLPVIGTDVEGIRDVIAHEKNGFLVRPDDEWGLKKALSRILKDKGLREKMSAESRKMAIEKYSLRRCLSEYELYFKTLASRVSPKKNSAALTRTA